MEKLLTPKHVASVLNISTSTVRRLYQDGELQCLRLGFRTVRFDHADVEAFLRRNMPPKMKQIPDFKPIPLDFGKLPPAGI